MDDGTGRRARLAGDIRAELGRQKKTRTALAAALGISTDALRDRLNGKKPFYFEEVETAASFFGLQTSELTARSDVAA